MFFKSPTCIIGPDDEIVYPEGATDVHYEAEMVVVIGKKAKNVSVADAPNYIFGITAGDDVSERYWQDHDLQWFRGKGCDTFGPIGPAIVSGLNYKNLQVQSRLNGQLKQSQRTSDLIFDADMIVSYMSKFITLMPGDVIFTGTPGETSAMKAGDVIEIEVEGVGILRNTIAATSAAAAR
jgi:2-keto-4-pentenoate hydratase/2-oxohepta-3-ene-1,7-dioic acid hydratase in catechol pathway